MSVNEDDRETMALGFAMYAAGGLAAVVVHPALVILSGVIVAIIIWTVGREEVDGGEDHGVSPGDDAAEAEGPQG